VCGLTNQDWKDRSAQIQNLVSETSRRLPLWRAVNVIYSQSTTLPSVGIHSTRWGVCRATRTHETYSLTLWSTTPPPTGFRSVDGVLCVSTVW